MTPARTATRAKPVWGAAQDAPLVVLVELEEVELEDPDPDPEEAVVDEPEPVPVLEDELEFVVPEATWKVTPLYWSRIKVAACSARP